MITLFQTVLTRGEQRHGSFSDHRTDVAGVKTNFAGDVGK
jgi:hypothetical protein